MTASAKADDRFLTVTEIGKELGVTARALRFYEDKGLITPRRVATTRIYSNRERARMILILRGKRLGFSLREIKTYLDLYDADPKHITQSQALLKQIDARIALLEEQRIALDQALVGLKDLKVDALAGLAKAAQHDAEARPALSAQKSSAPKTSAKSQGPRVKSRVHPFQRPVPVSVAANPDHQEPSL